MADSVVRQILGAARTKLQAIDGSGSWHLNLSGTDQVYVGELPRPARPGVETAFVTLESVISTPGARLGYFKRTVTVGVLVFVPAAMASGNGVLEATDALDDVMRTFEADRYLGLSGLGVRDLRVDGTAFSGQELNMKGYGVCSCNLIVDFSTTTGA